MDKMARSGSFWQRGRSDFGLVNDFRPNRKSPRFNSMSITNQPISFITPHVVRERKQSTETGDPADSFILETQSIASGVEQRGRLAAMREREIVRRASLENAEFLACKKMSDKELSEQIKSAPGFGRLQDSHHGHHLIHWCVLSDKPLSIIAICSSNSSTDEMNAKDSRGRTPLHHAVMGELTAMVELLLRMGVTTTVFDNTRLMPIHHAANIGNTAILQLLLETSDEANAAGDGGYTPLHFAAASDQPKVIEMLLEHNASMFLKSSNGAFPVHTAAKCGAARALKAMINKAEPLGIDHRLLLSLRDREGQLPIHIAVNNGDAESVIVCLTFGSSLLSKKDNGSTPVHYAATQGNLELLKTMYDFNPDTFKEALDFKDFSGRTPLHWAAIFDHDEVVKYLIKMSNVNTFDNNKQTPLLSAASNASWGTLTALLTHKETNTEVIDQNQRNALHQAVIQGINLEEKLPVWKQVREVERRCNEADRTGSTPLHYAAWNGDTRDVQALLSLGARTNVRNKFRQNPFHIACKNGCYDVCLLLLNEKDGSRLKNEEDETGQSPLHIAAARGFANIVNILLQRGACISKSKSMDTPLHLAAAGGHITCIHSLLSVHLDLLDAENMDGNTPLHLAAGSGHAAAVNLLLKAGAAITYNAYGKCFYDDALTMGCREVLEVCIHHKRWHEILSVFSQYHGQLFLGLIRYLPICCIMVLNRCVDPSSSDKNSPSYSVTYNFRYLQLGDEYQSFAKAYKLKYSPLLPIEMMLQHERDDCLRHKLVNVYLKKKWSTYGSVVNFLDIFVYCLFMGSLTLFVMMHEPLKHYHTQTEVQRKVASYKPLYDPGQDATILVQGPMTYLNFTDKAQFDWRKNWFPPEARNSKIDAISFLCLLIVIAYSAALICKDVVQLLTLGVELLRDLSLYLEMATYSCSLYFALPYAFGFSTHTQWEAASIAIFLAWFNFLVLCRRFQVVGLYIVMYLEIMKTLLQILFIFLVLMIAFGLAFFVLQSKEKYRTNENPLLSMYRMLILVFEIEYVLTVVNPMFDNVSDTMHFPTLSLFFLALFLLFMPLLLVNLMIGLAVGDIQSVLRSAHQQTLATQVVFFTKLERRFPFLSDWAPETLIVYPNDNDRSSFLTWVTNLLTCSPKEDDHTHGSNRFNDRLSPTMQSLTETRREIAQIRRYMVQIMRHMELHVEDYTFRDPHDEGLPRQSISRTSRKSYVFFDKAQMRHSNIDNRS